MFFNKKFDRFRFLVLKLQISRFIYPPSRTYRHQYWSYGANIRHQYAIRNEYLREWIWMDAVCSHWAQQTMKDFYEMLISQYIREYISREGKISPRSTCERRLCRIIAFWPISRRNECVLKRDRMADIESHLSSPTDIDKIMIPTNHSTRRDWVHSSGALLCWHNRIGMHSAAHCSLLRSQSRFHWLQTFAAKKIKERKLKRRS